MPEINVHKSAAFIGFFGNGRGCQTKKHNPISASRCLVLLGGQDLNMLFICYFYVFFSVAVINMFVRLASLGYIPQWLRK